MHSQTQNLQAQTVILILYELASEDQSVQSDGNDTDIAQGQADDDFEAVATEKINILSQIESASETSTSNVYFIREPNVPQEVVQKMSAFVGPNSPEMRIRSERMNKYKTNKGN